MIKEKSGTTADLAYRIFGKNFRLIYNDAVLSPYLNKELQLYPVVEQCNNDIIIDIGTSAHSATAVGNNKLLGSIRTPLAITHFYGEGEECTNIIFRLHIPVNKLHSAIQRWMSLGYNDRIERIGQIFHEQVLVPASFLINDRSPLHGSCIKMGDKTVIFGGKGGVGKTSLELEFCKSGDGTFVTDDMAVLDKQAIIYPNLNYPKIYAYNVIGYGNLGDQILESRGLLDKLHWKSRSSYNLAKTRRRLSPAVLFGSYISQPIKATHYYILNRSSTEDIEFTELDADEASSRSVDILMEEFRYLLQNDLNGIVLEKESLSKKWKDILKDACTKMKCTEILIPENMDHAEFRKQLRELIIHD